MLAGGLVAQAPLVVEADVEPGAALAGRQPAHRSGPSPPAPVARALPQVGADHHRVFQALAGMHRHHRHHPQLPVAVGQMRLRHRTFRVESQPPQPVGRGRQPLLLAVESLLHQGRHLLQIGQQPALAPQAAQHLGLQQFGQHPQQSLHGHPLAEHLQPARQAAPGRGAGLADLSGTPAQQGRSGQQSQAVASGRVDQGIEQALQCGRGRTGQHIHPADQATGDPLALQSGPQGLGLIAITHQQADVVGAQGALAVAFAQLGRRFDQVGGEGGDPGGQLAFQCPLGDRFLARFSLAPQPEQLQGGALRPAALGFGLHLGHRKAGAAQARRLHQPVEGRHQRWAGAIVAAQFVAG